MGYLETTGAVLVRGRTTSWGCVWGRDKVVAKLGKDCWAVAVVVVVKTEQQQDTQLGETKTSRLQNTP